MEPSKTNPESEEERKLAESFTATEEIIATVTRIVGDDLIYAAVESGRRFVFTPADIKGYKGERLKTIGILKGTKVKIGFHSTQGVLWIVPIKKDSVKCDESNCDCMLCKWYVRIPVGILALLGLGTVAKLLGL